MLAKAEERALSGDERKEPTLPSFDGPIYPPPRGPGAPARPAPSLRPGTPAPDDREPPASPDAFRVARGPSQPQPVAMPQPAPPPTEDSARLVFVSDAIAGPDTLGRAASLSRLSELLAHRGARGPLSVALLGGPGSGKTHALADVVEGASLLSTAALSAPHGPFLPRIVALRLEASDLGDMPEATVAERLHARISREYSHIAEAAAEEAAHASADPRRTAKALADSLDDSRRRLVAERHARDEAANRRARLTETVLYDTADTQIEAYARANRGKFEPALRSFGFAGQDAVADYKGLVQSLAECGGPGNRLLASLRALWAYKGQKKLMVLAIVFFALAWGFDMLAADRSWFASLEGADSLKGVAAWFASHRHWLVNASRAGDLIGLLCLVLLAWRAWRFTQPLWRGAKLLDMDVTARRSDLERQIAHHAQRVEALTREADALADRAEEADRRAGGLERAGRVTPAFLDEGPSRASQARAYLSALDSLVPGDPAKSAGAAPTRIVVAIDSLDRLPPARALATLTAVSSALARPCFALVTAFDPRHFGDVEGGPAAVARLVQTPFNLGAAEAPGWTAFVEQLAGRAAPQPRTSRAPQNGSTLDTPLAEPETRLLAALAQLAGPSPRGVNRLVNLYRIARHDAPDDLAALACMLALRIGGTDAERQAVARGLASADSFGAFAANDGGPRVAAALAAASAAQGGAVTNASARKANAVARMWTI